MRTLTELLNNPEEHYPGNFDTPQRANALLTGLCQDAATELAQMQAEIERLKATLALYKMAEESRTSGLRLDDWDKIGCVNHDCDKCKAAAQPAPVQEPVAWLYPEGLEALQNGKCWTAYPTKHDGCNIPLCAPPAAQPAPVQEPVAVVSGYYGGQCVVLPTNPARLFNSGTAFYTAPQPVPVKTYHDGKPWPVAPKPWAGLTPAEVLEALTSVDPETKRLPVGFSRFACAIENKLKEKNT